MSITEFTIFWRELMPGSARLPPLATLQRWVKDPYLTKAIFRAAKKPGATPAYVDSILHIAKVNRVNRQKGRTL